jgi:hypothetical protein
LMAGPGEEPFEELVTLLNYVHHLQPGHEA